MYDDKGPETHFCKLLDGSVLPYDAADGRDNMFDSKVFEFIGKGIIWTINNKNQGYSLDNPDHIVYLYRRVKKHDSKRYLEKYS